MGRNSKARDLIDEDDFDDQDDQDDQDNQESDLYGYGCNEEDGPDSTLPGGDEAEEEEDMEEIRAMIATLESSAKSPVSMQGPSKLYQSFSARVDEKSPRATFKQSLVLPTVMQPGLFHSTSKGPDASIHVPQTDSVAALPGPSTAKLTKGHPPLRSCQRPPAPSQKAVKVTTSKPSRKVSEKTLATYAAYQKTHYQDLEHLYLVMAGHVDAGKSTLMGHLLYLLGCVSQKSLDLYQRESQKIGKASFAFAWILDETEEERARGITMDVAVHSFISPLRRWTILDAPGHKDFMSQMIQAAFLADMAILVIDASEGEFETGWLAGGQSKEHALALKSAGVKNIIVAVNKMDKVHWSFTRFQYIQGTMEPFLNHLGYRDAALTFIPVSGYLGLHVVKRHDLSPDYPKDLPCLLEALDRAVLESDSTVNERSSSLIAAPFRAIIYQLLKTSGSGNVFVEVKIESGMVSTGEMALVLPLAQKCTIKSIEVKEIVESGFTSVNEKNSFAKDYVTLALSGIEPTFLRTGQLLCTPAFPVSVASKVTASILVFDDSIELMTPGFAALFYYRNTMDSCHVSKLVSLVDPKDQSVIRSSPRFLRKGDLAHVEISFSKAIAIEAKDVDRQLSRFILRASGLTIAGGVVLACG